MNKKNKNESIMSYIERLIKEAQNTKIYIGARAAENLILVNRKLFNKFMKNKKYNMTYLGNNRICLDIHPEGKYDFVNPSVKKYNYDPKIYIPNNIDRSKLPDIGQPIEINILYRWYKIK